MTPEYLTPGLTALIGVLLALYLRSIDRHLNARIDDVKQDAAKAHAEIGRNIDHLRTELRGEVDGLRTELKGDIDGLRTELKGDIDGLRTELKGDIDGLRTELKGDIDGLRTEISDMRRDITDINGRLGRVEGFLELKSKDQN